MEAEFPISSPPERVQYLLKNLAWDETRRASARSFPELLDASFSTMPSQPAAEFLKIHSEMRAFPKGWSWPWVGREPAQFGSGTARNWAAGLQNQRTTAKRFVSFLIAAISTRGVLKNVVQARPTRI